MARSIYRGCRDLPFDVQIQDSVHGEAPARPREPPPVHLRRAQPLLYALPRTKVWLASLPEQVRPDAFTAQFARISNAICAVWDRPGDCKEYLRELLTDRRGGRAGFPVSVVRELNNLYAYYVGMHDAFERSRNK